MSAKKEQSSMPHDPRPQVLYVIGDTFGQRLMEHRGVPPERQVSFEEFRDGVAPPADVVVAVHSGGDEELRDEIDRICAERGTPSVGLQLQPTRIVCGPVVVPGRTACFACHRKRAAQHAGSARHYDIDASLSGLSEGFGPQHLAVASGLVELALTEIASGVTGIGGTVRTFNLVSGAVSAASTVSVNRCPRCGDRFAEERAASAMPVPELLQ
ncbi:TOMM precursor leader peptide-binding protein [Streptomyces griseocarneus]|uniref:TOMM precursor leader peptide-binding protein n=1 Tax=Streptomyces griseocarneus TaxID=51201 RepID=UPI001CCF2BDE|nr:TOMM precursor leader peptide-binding protein [Streptomyces griseocarneus]MBZ6476808.1 TOMM precursor leader peptide-binding protein [Streptomyces griseocarneus]